MSKIQVTLDAAKLRNLISKRTFNTRDGQQVTVQEVKFDLVEMKQESQKTVYTGNKYQLVKTHFAVAQQTREEREAKAEANFIGEGITVVWDDQPQTQTQPQQQNEQEQDSGMAF